MAAHLELSSPQKERVSDERRQDDPIDSFASSDAFSSRRHRLIIFVGPHKSASSSVQEFFAKYASKKHPKQRLPSLKNWTWPWNSKRRSYLGRKAFAALMKEQADSDLILQVYQNIRDELQAQQHPSTFQLILGTEEFDRFGTTPWSHWDGIKSASS